jgi:hypothetical protein
MHAVLVAYGRALRSALSVRMFLLSLLPLLLALLLWGVLLYFGLQPLVDLLQAWFTEFEFFQSVSNWLGWAGLGVVRAVMVPLLAMLLLTPLMIVTTLVFMGVAAMPAIIRDAATRTYPELERKQGGTLLGSLRTGLGAALLFAVVWLVTLPLFAVAPLAVLVQVLLWAWLTAKVMCYDALSEHASQAERESLMLRHRLPLLAIGVVSGLFGALPGMAWIGGALAFIAFPVLAPVALWLYVTVFMFTALWFVHYTLQALRELRAAEAVGSPIAATSPQAGDGTLGHSGA